MPLTRLTLQDEAAFAEFFQDFQRHDPINCDFYRQGDENFADYVQLLDDHAHGQNLPCGTCLAAIFGIRTNKAKFWVRCVCATTLIRHFLLTKRGILVTMLHPVRAARALAAKCCALD